MKKLLLTAFSIMIFGSLSSLTTALDINELFDGEIPLVENAYQRLLTDCDCTRGYSPYSNSNPASAVTFRDDADAFINAKSIIDSSGDSVEKYLLFVSPYSMKYIRGLGKVDEKEFVIKEPKPLSINEYNEYDLYFYISSKDVNVNTTYYAFIVPVNADGEVGTPAGDIEINIMEGIAQYDGNDILCTSNGESGQYTVTIEATKYGTVSQTSVSVEQRTAIKTKLNTLTIGGKRVIATPNKASKGYKYVFDGWTNNCGDTVKGNCTITANFRREINEESPLDSITKGNKLDTGSMTKIDKDEITKGKKIDTGSMTKIDKGADAKLTNNLTKTVEFKSNEVNKKVVFDGTYTALKDNISINSIMIRNLDYDYREKSNCDSEDIMRFQLKINGEEIANGNALAGPCRGIEGGGYFQEVYVKKGSTISIQIEGETDINTQPGKRNYEVILRHAEDFDQVIWGEASAKLAPIEVEENSIDKGADAKLINNLTKTVELKENETSRKVVFDGKYTAQKDTSFNSIEIDKLFEDECRYPNGDANKRDIVKFYLKINGKEKATIEVDECDKGIGAWFNEINVEKGTSVDVTIKAENVRQTGKMLDRKYKVTLRHSENFDQVIWGEASAKLVPIKIIDVKDDQETTKFGTISIANPDNPSEGITIMDRNLGATSNDITSSDSYGYYYQWGNNYGFDSNSKFKTSSDKVTWNKSYNNHGYYDNIFRTTDGDYWVDGSHDGLWGGENDSWDNNRGSNETNHNDRQGPCPDGYHIPSAGEWGLLVKYRKNTYEENVTLQGSQGQYSFSDKTATKNFSKYFKLPLAGSLSSYNGYLLSQEKKGGYWSSSINIENEGYAEHLYIDYDSLNRVYATAASPRSEGMPIRCFKNTYEPTTKNIEKIKINNEEEKKLTPQDSITIINKSSKTVYNDGKQGSYSPEMVEGYEFAYEHGITSASSIEKAKMNSPLTRIEMAKMLSYYAINVLGMEPDTSKRLPRFGDVSDRLNSKYNNAITLAYQLGIMGQNIKSENYRPNDKVTRAEFATALSRLLYGTQDGTGKEKYYRPHIVKLSQEGIISKTNPKLIEKRGYVMLMLMRSVE